MLLDTSSIVFAFSNRVDIFDAVEERVDATVVVSTGVVRELKGLSLGRSKEGRAARVALRIMSKHNVEIVKDDRDADGWLLSSGSAGNVYVCTNDIKLKRALKDKGVRAFSVSRSGAIR